MQVVILAGGAGSRVGPITEFRVPKALMQINNKSVLEHQVMSLPTGAKVLLLIGDGKFKGQFESESEKLFSKYRVPIDIVSEGKSLGTGGALIAARENLDKKFIVLMGDILFSEDLNKFWNFMKFESSSIGILVRRTDHPEDSDLAKLNEYGDVIRIEKYPHRSHINFDRTYGLTGIFYIRKKLVSNTKPSMKID